MRFEGWLQGIQEGEDSASCCPRTTGALLTRQLHPSIMPTLHTAVTFSCHVSAFETNACLSSVAGGDVHRMLASMTHLHESLCVLALRTSMSQEQLPPRPPRQGCLYRYLAPGRY